MSFSGTRQNPGNKKNLDDFIYLKTDFKLESIFKLCIKILKMNLGQIGEEVEKI